MYNFPHTPKSTTNGAVTMNEPNGSQVLVVDDDASMQRMLRQRLEREGYAVQTAPNGKEGLNLIRKEVFNLIITDVRMPKLGGDELARAVAQFNPNIPIIVMTAFGEVNEAVQLMQDGIYHYFTKPFDVEDLVAKVKKALPVAPARRVFEPEQILDVLPERYRRSRKAGNRRLIIAPGFVGERGSHRRHSTPSLEEGDETEIPKRAQHLDRSPVRLRQSCLACRVELIQSGTRRGPLQVAEVAAQRRQGTFQFRPVARQTRQDLLQHRRVKCQP